MKNGYVMTSSERKGNFCWPSVARIPDGRLAVAASGFRLGHVCPFGKVAVSFSEDEGESWSAPRVVFDSPLEDRDAGICSWKGKIVLTTFNNTLYFQKKFAEEYYSGNDKAEILKYISSVSKEQEREFLGSYYLITDCEMNILRKGKLPISSPHGMSVLRDGSLFYAGRTYGHEDITGRKNDMVNRIGVMKSEDGKNFGKPHWIDLPEKEVSEGVLFCEPYAVQLSSGRILLQIRAQKEGLFTVYQCFSDDGGRTFGVPQKLRVPEGEMRGSPPHLLETSGGELVLTYGYREKPYGQRARISRDGGENWGEEIVLRADGTSWDLGYPATAECADGSLITVYYQIPEGCKNRSIMYTKWSLQR